MRARQSHGGLSDLLDRDGDWDGRPNRGPEWVSGTPWTVNYTKYKRRFAGDSSMEPTDDRRSSSG